MKQLKNKFIYLLYFLLTTVFLTSYEYTERTNYELQQMKEPIILYDKSKLTLWYGITLKDGNGDLHIFGNMSSIANYIGETYSINDTIPKLLMYGTITTIFELKYLFDEWDYDRCDSDYYLTFCDANKLIKKLINEVKKLIDKLKLIMILHDSKLSTDMKILKNIRYEK